jgi:hypothetical protein
MASAVDRLETMIVSYERLQAVVEVGHKIHRPLDALVDQRRLSVWASPQSVSESPNRIGPNSASDGVGTSPPLPRTTGPLDSTVRFNS